MKSKVGPALWGAPQVSFRRTLASSVCVGACPCFHSFIFLKESQKLGMFSWTLRILKAWLKQPRVSCLWLSLVCIVDCDVTAQEPSKEDSSCSWHWLHHCHGKEGKKWDHKVILKQVTYDGAGNTSGTSGLLCPGVSNTKHIQWGWRVKDSFHKATFLFSLSLAFCHDATKLWTKFRFSSPSFILCNKATMSCSRLRKPFYLEKRPGCE